MAEFDGSLPERVLALERELHALRQTTQRYAASSGPAFHKRHVRLAKTVKGPDPVYPATGNVFYIVFLDGSYTETVGTQSPTYIERQDVDAPTNVVHSNRYLDEGEIIEALEQNDQWWHRDKTGDSQDLRVVVIDGTAGEPVTPNGGCVYPGTVQTLTGSDMCGSAFDDSTSVWVYFPQIDENLPHIVLAGNTYVGFLISDAYTVSPSDTRQLFIAYDPQVQPPLVGIVQPESDNYIDHGYAGRIALVEATGVSAPFSLAVPETPIYIDATNHFCPRVWEDSLVLVQAHRMNDGKYELHIVQAYSAKIVRGQLTGRLDIGTTSINVDTLTTFDGTYPITDSSTAVSAANDGFWGADNDIVFLCWDDNTGTWTIVGMLPPQWLIYRAQFTSQHTNPATNVALTVIDTLGSGYPITAKFPTGTSAANYIGAVGDASNAALAIWDMQTNEHILLNAGHVLFEPLVGIEIDVASEEVWGHQKYISVFTWTQTGDNYEVQEATTECDGA